MKAGFWVGQLGDQMDLPRPGLLKMIEELPEDIEDGNVTNRISGGVTME